MCKISNSFISKCSFSLLPNYQKKFPYLSSDIARYMHCSIYNIIEKLFIDHIYHPALQIHINKYKDLGCAFYRNKHIHTYILLYSILCILSSWAYVIVTRNVFWGPLGRCAVLCITCKYRNYYVGMYAVQYSM